MYIVVDNQTGEIKAQTQDITRALSIAQALTELFAYVNKHTFEVEVA